MITLILTNGLCGFAQVTIEECQRRAQEHYPLVRQYVQIEEAEASRLANAGKGYLPQVKLSGNASYRSEVTRLPFDASQWGIPGLDIPALSKDQYALSLDALQVLWDGGEIKSGKESVRTAAQVERRRVAVGLYALYQQVNTAFSGSCWQMPACIKTSYYKKNWHETINACRLVCSMAYPKKQTSMSCAWNS